MTEPEQDSFRVRDAWNAELGTEYVEITADRVVLRCRAAQQLLSTDGTVHGGVYSSLIETAASIGAGLWWAERGNVVGVMNHTNTLSAVTAEDELRVTGSPLHREDSHQLWRVDVTANDGRLVATGDVRLANIASADAIGR
jgi:uncharacterized protein (TIGR00369 family)